MRKLAWWQGLLAVGALAGVAGLAGCGDDAVAVDGDAGKDAAAPIKDTGTGADTTLPPEEDAGTDTGTTDTGTTDTGATDTGTTDSATDTGVDAGPALLTRPSNGSAISLSPDEANLAVANRGTGTVSIFGLTYPGGGAPPVIAKKAELAVGAADSEPWQVVIGPDNDSAYVITRKDQKLYKLTGLKTTPAVGQGVTVGSELTGVALTPTGASAWVASWSNGTAVEVSTATMTIANTVDLNAALIATTAGGLPVLGAGTNDGGLATRPGLAHPRSIAITNGGTGVDSVEYAYVTEYFAQQTAAESAPGDGGPGNSDTRKIGVLYRIKLSDRTVTSIPLAPLSDIGFKDEKNQTVGCYPNQLQSVTLNDKYAYVTSVCASPAGPTGPRVSATACTPATISTDCPSPTFIEPVCVAPADALATVCVDIASVKTTTAPLVSVVDISLAVPAEKTAATASLNRKFFDLYATKTVADNGQRRLPLLANDVTFVPASPIAYVSANGTDAVFRVAFDNTTGNIASVGTPAGNNFIDLTPNGFAGANPGSGPVGVVAGSKTFAFTANEFTRNVSIIDLNAQAITGVASSSALPAGGTIGASQLKGQRFFNTGLGRWSLRGQGWGACQSCHTDGLTDNVTWYFGRGARQSTSLDGTFATGNGADQRLLNWTAVFDEMADFEGNTRGTSGGVGAITHRDGAPDGGADGAAGAIGTPDRIDLATAGNVQAGLSGSAARICPASPGGGGGDQLAQENPPCIHDDWSAVTEYIKIVRTPRAPTNLVAADVAAGAALFSTQGNCQACHSGAKWTISKVFYTPDADNTALNLTNANKLLLTKAWTPPSGFPSGLLPATPGNRFMRAGSAATDQIQCILRPVGTFNVAEPGVGIAELRVNMSTVGQGAEANGNGFNPPSLLNAVGGAPYFHAGNARTLESLFSSTFAAHYQAIAPNFLTAGTAATDIRQIIQYLLSIDESTTPITIPAAGANGGDFCAPGP